jgi:hypothetical protein
MYSILTFKMKKTTLKNKCTQIFTQQIAPTGTENNELYDKYEINNYLKVNI